MMRAKIIALPPTPVPNCLTCFVLVLRACRRFFQKQHLATHLSAQFEDVTVASGLAKRQAPGWDYCALISMAIVGRDIFIADDGMPNRLYINQRNGTFIEEAAQRGIAHNALIRHNPEMLEAYVLLADLHLHFGRAVALAELAERLDPADRRLPALRKKIQQN